MQVRAHNRAPEPSAWSGVSGTEVPAGVPGEPPVTAQPVASDEGRQIDVTWAPPADNGDVVRGYRVVVAGGPGAGTFEVAASQTLYQLRNASNGAEYTFEVSARNKAGWGDPGSASAIAFGVPSAPRAPTVVRTSSDAPPGQGFVDVDWPEADGNGSLVTRYEVQTTAGSPSVVGRTARVSDLPAGARPTISVRACNARGCGAFGEGTTVDAGVVRTLPGAPTSPEIQTASPDPVTGRPAQLVLSWVAPGETGGTAVEEYEYQVAVNGAPLRAGRSTATTETIDLPQLATNGSTITLSVRARSGTGWGGWTAPPASLTVTWTEPGQPPDPGDGTDPGASG
ncbi:fibronectin type III domain-containing protein [Cellulomonas sp. C5510]|uniref:fibronectin type III domain-containing protein n=1 Tax=Cellulomonas sp. C5510 TaxID=2871170 RepID=UPI00351CC933